MALNTIKKKPAKVQAKPIQKKKKDAKVQNKVADQAFFTTITKLAKTEKRGKRIEKAQWKHEAVNEDSDSEEEQAASEASEEEQEANEDSEEEQEANEASTDDEAPKESPIVKTDPDKKGKKAGKKNNKEVKDRKVASENADIRTICVKNVPENTTEADIRKHFAECGVMVKVVLKSERQYVFVEFADVSGRDMALKLHNSILNENTINVYQRTGKQHTQVAKDATRTILLKNTQDLTSMPASTLTSIFSKYGEIEEMDVLCRKKVLAFITYKNEKSAKAAMELNGQIVNDVHIEIQQFKNAADTPKTSVFVQNVKPGVTEKEIEDVLEKAGPVEHVFVRSGFAIVKFKDLDGFCKSFLLNESIIRGQMIFLEPYSEKKMFAMGKKSNGQNSHFAKQKRPMVQGGGYQKRIKRN